MKFAQIYRKSMIPAVQVNKYTVSAFQLQQTFSKSVGFLMWSADNLDLYLAMMAHWIGRDEKTGVLTMKAMLIAFHYLPSRHTGEEIAKTMPYLIDCVKVAMASISVQLSQ